MTYVFIFLKRFLSVNSAYCEHPLPSAITHELGTGSDGSLAGRQGWRLLGVQCWGLLAQLLLWGSLVTQSACTPYSGVCGSLVFRVSRKILCQERCENRGLLVTLLPALMAA